MAKRLFSQMKMIGSLYRRGEIQRFVERPLIDRAVAEEAERDAIFAPVLDCKGQPNSQRYMRGTIAWPPYMLCRLSKKCIDPPSPREQPVSFPKSSAMHAFALCPGPRHARDHGKQ
jgi:hypothetical protein